MSIHSAFEFEKIRGQMVDLCLSEIGQAHLSAVEPSFERIIIRRDRQRLYEAMEACVRFGGVPLEGVRDCSSLLVQSEKGRALTAQELLEVLRLLRSVKAAVAYEETIREVPHDELNDLFSTLNVQDALVQRITSIINDYGEVKDTASSQLSEIRSQLLHAGRRIQEAVEQFRQSHPDAMVDSIVTMRAGRTVILVHANEKNRYGGIVYGDSKSGQTSYIEPSVLMHANNRRLELEREEEDEIARILAEVSSQVGAKAQELKGDLETLALLDSIFARAEWGVRQHGSAAILREDMSFQFERARHPLIEEDTAVTNNYSLKEPYHCLLITGPNTGGKTVSMKLFGLFTLMTYCGMPVTAEKAELPFFDHIYADIGDDQSVASSLSSFSAHVEKQAEMLREATDHSLVLLDEIGSGTDPREGESLAIAVLNELRRRHVTVIATTHYSRLKAYGRRHDDILVASVEFDHETLRPTYRYLEGITGESNALLVAERCGLPSSVVNYAKFLKEQAKSDEEGMMEKLEAQLRETERNRQELEERLKKIRDYQKQLAEETETMKEKREVLLDEARSEAAEIRESAREEADEILRDLRASATHAKYHELLDKRSQLNEKVIQESVTPEEDRPFAVGDTVELRSSGAVALVKEVRKKELLIVLNGREVRVKPAGVRHSRKRLPKQTPVKQAVSSVEVPRSMSLECNLIGLRVDEAREEMLDYMDSAKLCGLKSFRIIHGDGSGALRNMVQEVLAKDSSVDSYRYGMPNEGGTGATVVVMKN
ncbi:MAG: endonuclease MutS2 [Solobacterium sp.]|nr:endonuclease MutS2 [Solobacterium sp.]